MSTDRHTTSPEAAGRWEAYDHTGDHERPDVGPEDVRPMAGPPPTGDLLAALARAVAKARELGR